MFHEMLNFVKYFSSQILCQMACTQRKWCDFVVFLPNKCGKQGDLIIQRIEFDEAKWTVAEELISRYIVYNV